MIVVGMLATADGLSDGGEVLIPTGPLGLGPVEHRRLGYLAPAAAR
jgi:hypothetical protein